MPPPARRRRDVEGPIRRGIRDFLRTTGWAVYDMEQNRPTRQTPGFTDLVAFGHGHILFIEVKTPHGVVTPAQAFFEDILGKTVRGAGGKLENVVHVVWRSPVEAAEWCAARGILRRAGAR